MPNRLSSFKFFSQCLSTVYGKEDINKLRKEITQDNIAWEDIITLANNMMLTPALWVSLSDKGLTRNLPSDLYEFLKELHDLNSQRNKKLKSQALEAIQTLNSIDVKPVLLKGSGYLFLNSFGDIGTRMMYDLDIMVPKLAMTSCIKAFHDLDYHSDPEDDEQFINHHHSAPLIRTGEFGAIELHHELLSQKASSILPTTDAWKQIEALPAVATTVYVLSPTHRVLHSILHSQIVDGYHKRYIINLRSLHDLANLIKADGDKIDWVYIQKAMHSHTLKQALLGQLYQANKLFGIKWPEPMRANLSCRFHYLLCVAGIRWKRFARFNRDMRRYSRIDICQRYNCEDKGFQIIKFRLIYTAELIKRWIKGITRLFKQ